MESYLDLNFSKSVSTGFVLMAAIVSKMLEVMQDEGMQDGSLLETVSVGRPHERNDWKGALGTMITWWHERNEILPGQVASTSTYTGSTAWLRRSMSTSVYVYVV